MQYDKSKYRVWTWKHPLMLHWIINPGLAVNEIVLGQRVPRVTLVEKDTGKTLDQRTFIPCPHCNTLHPGLKWSQQNKTAFGNWFGFYCDHCGRIIPCLTNLTSYLLLGLTFPLWGWFRKPLKKKWLQLQKEKFSKPISLQSPEVKWWKLGIGWTVIMYLIMEIILPLMMQEKLTARRLLLGAVIWIAAGLLFGWLMKIFIVRKKNRDKQKLQTNSASHIE